MKRRIKVYLIHITCIIIIDALALLAGWIDLTLSLILLVAAITWVSIWFKSYLVKAHYDEK